MTFTINKDVFLEKLAFSSRFTSSRLSSISSLQGVLIKNEKGILHYYATNLNSYYHTTQKTEIKNEFKIVVEPKKITEFLSLIPSGKIEIDVTDKKLTIVQGKSKGEFSLFASEEFPLPPAISGKNQKIKADFFLKSLSLVLFAASTDETRPVLSGIDFAGEDDELIVVATDGFRLSLIRQKKEIEIPQMIIPASFMAEIINVAKKEETISFNYSEEEKITIFQIGEHQLYSRIIEGEYPPFEKVIPTEIKTTLTLDKEEFLRNVKLVAIFARDLSNIIILDVAKEGVELRPKADGAGGNVASQDAEVSGPEIKIAFNYKFVLDFLNHIEAKKVTIELVRSDAPALFKADRNPEFLHIIMPVRIQE